MSDWTTNAALIIFLIITVGDKALNFLKNRGIDLQLMSRRIEELHDWHDHDDPDQAGVKVWWNQKYISQLIQKLSDLQVTQTTLLSQIHEDWRSSSEVNRELLRLIVKLIDKQDKILEKIK